MTDIIQRSKERLLDLGKRNRMLNYKETKYSSVELRYPSACEIYKRCSEGQAVEFFSVDDVTERVLKRRDLTFAEMDEDAASEILKKSSDQCGSRKVVAFKKCVKLGKVLAELDKKAVSAMNEQGVNLLYAAFGFLRWKDPSDAYEYLSPLILVPARLTKSGSRTFSMRQSEDDAVLNPALAYKFSVDFKLELPYPDGEEELSAYLQRVCESVAKLGFTVEERAVCGLFSYEKINMYMDLKQNEALILQNENIRRLAGIPVDTSVKCGNYSEMLAANLRCVYEADSSQQDAVLAARSGMSFVLQGPPGTGKSQTITNIIADGLYNGKKILFVSEKLAALQVVYRNLQKAGLADFCLQLHSDKTNKRDVIGELNRTLRLEKTRVSDAAFRESRKLDGARNDLAEYVRLIQTKKGTGDLSLYELISRISTLRDYPDLPYTFESQKAVQDQIEEYLDIFRMYIRFSEELGYDYRMNAWYGFNGGEYLQGGYPSELFEAARAYYKELSERLKRLREKAGVQAVSLDDYEKFISALRMLLRMKRFDNCFLNAAYVSKVISIAKAQNDLQKEFLRAKEILDKKYGENLYKTDAESALRVLTKKGGIFCRLSGEYRSVMIRMKDMLKNQKKKLNAKEAAGDLRLLLQYQQSSAAYFKSYAECEHMIPAHFLQRELTDWETLLGDLQIASQALAYWKDFGYLTAMTPALFEEYHGQLAESVLNADDFFERFSETRRRLFILFDADMFDFQTVRVLEAEDRLTAMLGAMDEMRTWLDFRNLLGRMRNSQIAEFIDLCLDRAYSVSDLCKICEKSVYTQHVAERIAKSPQLIRFSRIGQDTLCEEFRRLDAEQCAIAKAEIREKLSADRPNTELAAKGGQLSVLMREGEKKRKLMPVRLLLKNLTELVTQLKPCFLMSPLSVSAYLDAEGPTFDTVIFDEASQIFPEDALGSIYRGKQVIIVGDSRQMPPEDFFTAMLEGDSDVYQEEDDVADYESVLDLACAVFPQRSLKWHYRSRSEQLIAFSNRNFYHGKLMTFPESVRPEHDFGVEFYRINGGVFHRKSKTNPKEADAVVKLIGEHIRNHPERSLGVIAFSKAQQQAIESAVEKAAEEDETLRSYLYRDCPEPFFVKNLENVQGDERDTILFSIAYAKGDDGKFILNFGPLNREGGQRRLNVAITRAKINMKVVSSVTADEIDVSKTQSQGVRLLREYLDYARRGGGADVLLAAGELTGMEDEVADFLEENGIYVDRRLGSSEFKIDAAVKNREGGGYTLAVECDGKTYQSAKSVRDRERLRADALSRMGWSYYRVWSVAWYKDPEAEKRKLLQAAMKAYSGGEEPCGRTRDTQFENKVDLPSENIFKFYRRVNCGEISKIGKTQQAYLKEMFCAILDAQTPVCLDSVARQMKPYFPKDKTDGYIKEYLLGVLKSLPNVSKKGDFLYTENQVPDLRISRKGDPVRDIEEIAKEEIARGIEVLVAHNCGIARSDLFRTLTKLLGYQRTTEKMERRYSGALLSLTEDRVVTETDGEIRLADRSVD